MSDSDLIAFAAVLAACLAALYARHARDAAHKANELSVYWQWRPLRLAVFQSMAQFAQYCSTYVTLHHMKAVNGTRDLVARIDTFKWEIEQHGPLAMPEVEAKVEEFVKGAWQMQRLLDRIAGGQNVSLEPVYSTAEENLDAVVDWFAEQNRELKTVFREHLAGS
jgi:hypothetical protein